VANFGVTTVGPTADTDNGNLLFGQPIHVTEAGALQSMSFYVTTASGTFRVGLYDNTGTIGPGHLLAQSGDVTAVTGWDIVPMPAVVLSPGTYWEYILPSSSTLAFVKHPNTGDKNPYVTQIYGPLANSFPATTSFSQSEWSFYTTILTPGGTTSAATTTTPTTTPAPTTTTTPTTTTATTSVAGSCFSSPGSCGYPDPAFGNMGVPSGTTLTPSGNITVTTNGAVINGIDVTGTITVEANNVTIQNSRVTCTGCEPSRGFAIFEPNGYSGLTVQNSQVSGGNIYAGGGQGGALNTFSHLYMFNCDECIQYGDKVTDSYILVNAVAPGAHYEAFYTSDATVDFEHDTFLNPHPQTATVFFDVNGGSGAGCDNNVTINNSLLAGGGFLFYLCNGSTSVGTSKSSITNNRFARCTTQPTISTSSGYMCQGVGNPNVTPDEIVTPDKNGYFPNGGFFGTDSAIYCSAVTWSNNAWDDNGRTVPC
jgi:hypothetical protein